MQDCSGLSNEAALSAAHSLSTFTNLRTLFMGECGARKSIATYEGTVTIAHALSKLPKLACLRIRSSSLAMEEKQHVKEILQGSASLRNGLDEWWEFFASK